MTLATQAKIWGVVLLVFVLILVLLKSILSALRRRHGDRLSAGPAL